MPATSTADPALTVVMVSYNTRDLTLAALRTLLETTRETAMRVVVLDNASTDGSAEAVAASFPEVELVRSCENLGFARANNRVAAAARTEWLLLLNPDTECRPGAVDRLMAFARARPEAGIWGGRTVFPDGRLNPSSCWMRITPWSMLCRATGLTALFPDSSLFNPEGLGGWARDSTREVDIVSGCFLLIRRALWEELGGFDLRYFMYGEDADLCLRAARAGWRPAITPEAEIVHLVGAASTRADKLVMVNAARVTLMRDHWPGALVPLGVGLHWLWGAVRLGWARVRALTGRPGDLETARKWRAVWARRRDWLTGYAP
ncbi:glycosyltransferase family 2 protein [Jannaschia formosa]|uniref:glycosyltransferase family 2 protein n=1 Tax=Jannaschia formosa TaxID=2259592 RepID=UPI000E1B8762|nr:glycosyltransferase family 2 protein [Jannaschia formosa]TFL17134.1 glycosyltransferase family 2 protein [Jannaschia formosa]